MRRVTIRVMSAAAALALGGCGGGSNSVPPAPHDAAPPEPACAPGELETDAGCEPAGVPPAECTGGFEPDGARGCRAILPETPCALGQMALPGETTCREVAPCGDGPWGDAPIEASTQFVDGSFVGISKGTEASPWTRIGDAIDAAAPGAAIAVAAGSYVEELEVTGKAVRLWGRCPASVEIVGSSAVFETLIVSAGAGGTEIHRVAIRGTATAVLVAGASDVLLDGVWLHDTAGRGVHASAKSGKTSVAVRRSLIERTTEIGVFASGAEAEVDASIVRDTHPDPAGQSFGRGVSIQFDPVSGTRGQIRIIGSIVERNRDNAVFATGADITIDSSIVRDTEDDASDHTGGRGVAAQPFEAEPSKVSLRSAIVANNRDSGVFCLGTDLDMDTTTVQATRERASDGEFGWGISVGVDSASPPRVHVQRSSVAGNRDVGIGLFGADATIETTLVRDTTPRASDSLHGRGINVQDDAASGTRATATLRACEISANSEFGVFAEGSDLTIEACAVRDMKPRPMSPGFGRGINIQATPESAQRSVATITGTLVDRALDVGIFVAGSDATVDSTIVQDTAARPDGSYGDGVVVSSQAGNDDASLVISSSRIVRSQRAGIASFGGSATVSGTVLECNTIALDGEFQAVAYSFTDGGGNTCSCEVATSTCQVESSALAPPEALIE